MDGEVGGTDLFSLIVLFSCRYTTLSYRAPEMVNLYTNKIITTKADIWVSEMSRAGTPVCSALCICV